MLKSFKTRGKSVTRLIVALTAALLAQPAAQSLTEKVCKDLYVVEQQESNGNKRTICLSPKGIKVISRERVLIASAPDWDTIVISNKRSHQFCKVPVEKFDGCGWFERLPVESLKLQKAEMARKVAGQSVSLFSENESKAPGTPQEKTSLLISTKIPTTEQIKAILAKLFGAERLNGLPLSVKVTTADGGSDERLQTLWCLERTLPKDFFSVPRSFKAQVSREVVESDSAKLFVRDRRNAPSSR